MEKKYIEVIIPRTIQRHKIAPRPITSNGQQQIKRNHHQLLKMELAQQQERLIMVLYVYISSSRQSRYLCYTSNVWRSLIGKLVTSLQFL